MTIEHRAALDGRLRGVFASPGSGDIRSAGMWAVALGLFAIELVDAPSVLDVGGLSTVLVAAVAGLPAGVLLTRPLAGWGVSLLGAILVPHTFHVLDGDPWPWPVTHGLVLIALTFAIACTSRFFVAIPIIVATSFLMANEVAPQLRPGWAVGVALIGVAGMLIHWRFAVRGELVRHEELTEVEKARRTVLEERTRIARDLHDVVAHRMSLVVVQAETAPYRINGLNEEARAELTAISATAREALEEMRALLGVLRNEDHERALRPQPQLADLPGLLEEATRAGVLIDFARAGSARPLSAAVQIGTYRIIQESLANAARHAPGAPVHVRLAYDTDVLRVYVANDAPAVAATSPTPGRAGLGLTGMRERATVVGGRFAAGPTPDGGYQVAAELPAPITAAVS